MARPRGERKHQVPTALTIRQIQGIDAIVNGSNGQFESRSQVIRHAVDLYLKNHQRLGP